MGWSTEMQSKAAICTVRFCTLQAALGCRRSRQLHWPSRRWHPAAALSSTINFSRATTRVPLCVSTTASWTARTMPVRVCISRAFHVPLSFAPGHQPPPTFPPQTQKHGACFLTRACWNVARSSAAALCDGRARSPFTIAAQGLASAASIQFCRLPRLLGHAQIVV